MNSFFWQIKENKFIHFLPRSSWFKIRTWILHRVIQHFHSLSGSQKVKSKWLIIKFQANKELRVKITKFRVNILFQASNNISSIAENLFRVDLFEWICFCKCAVIFVNNSQFEKFLYIMIKCYECICWLWYWQNGKMLGYGSKS